MSEDIRIAVASSDGDLVDQHFGRARSFFVFQLRDGEAEFVEERIGRPFCHGDEEVDESLKEAPELLSDCQEVYVLEFGKCAEDALMERGVRPIKCKGSVEEVVLRRAKTTAGPC